MLTGLRAASGPHTSRCPASRAILGQLAAAYKGAGGFRQLPATAPSPKNRVKYDEYQGFSGVLEHIDKGLPADDQAGANGH